MNPRFLIIIFLNIKLLIDLCSAFSHKPNVLQNNTNDVLLIQWKIQKKKVSLKTIRK